MRIEDPLHLGGDLVALLQNLPQAVGQPGQDCLCRGGAGDGDALLVQGGEDGLDEAGAHPRGAASDQREQLAAAGFAQPGRSAALRQQFLHRRMTDFGAQYVFQRRVDLRQQATDAVADPGGLGGQVVVVADQDLQLGERLITGVDTPQRVGQGPGGVSDDVSVTGVGLRGAGVQISEPSHRQAG